MDAVQDKINALHHKQLDETRKLALECNLKKNEAFAQRSKAIKEKGPKDFWFKVFNGHPDFNAELLGEYDANIFRALEDFTVTNKSDGFRIEMTFGPNEYFANTSLWFEEKEEGGQEPEIKTSGVNWKEGKGPAAHEEAAAEQEGQQQKKKAASNPWLAAQQQVEEQKLSGARREREEEGRGPSFFSFFEEVPPKPSKEGAASGNNQNDDKDDFGDDEGFGDDDSLVSALDEWDEMIDERREIARCICDEIWDDPSQYLTETQQ